MTVPAAVLFDPRAMWYVTRATGMVSLLLLTTSVVLGITEAVRWATARWPRFVTAGIHRNVSLLATTFILVHIATAIVDGYAPIGWIDAFLPFRSAYRPVWLGLGAVAFDLLVAIAITSLFRDRIGRRTWRLVHWAAYACWPVALVHGLGTGTDTKSTWVLGFEFACMATVVFAVWWRVAMVDGPFGAERRIAAATASVLIPLLIAGWVLAGPLQPGWARRAGTPQALLGAQNTGATNASDAPSSSVQPSGAPTSSQQGATNTTGLGPSFDAALTGTLTDPGPDRRGNDTITIDAQMDSGAVGSVHVVLSGRAVDGGGVSLTSGTVTISGRDGDSFTGAVTELRDTTIDAALQSSNGSSMSLSLDLVLDGTAVSGTAHGVTQ
jgi:hypothetical protein